MQAPLSSLLAMKAVKAALVSMSQSPLLVWGAKVVGAGVVVVVVVEQVQTSQTPRSYREANQV